MMRKLDLFLGGEQGQWALAQMPCATIGTIYTHDPKIAFMAQASTQVDLVFAGVGHGTERAEIGLSVHYPKILSENFIARYRKIYNIHPGYLPYGRGMYPVFWALWEHTLAGATLHEIDAGIDTGPIVEQVAVLRHRFDTGETLHERVKQAERKLIIEYCPRLIAGEPLPSKAQAGPGTYHTKAEFFALKECCNLGSLRGDYLLELILAFTYSGYTGLQGKVGGQLFEFVAKRLI